MAASTNIHIAGVTMKQLLDSSAATDDILSQRSQMLPRFDPARDDISEFILWLRSQMLSAPLFRISDREEDPTA
jgi:hypothetical protein